MSDGPSAMVEVRDVTKRFGAFTAVNRGETSETFGDFVNFNHRNRTVAHPAIRAPRRWRIA